MWRQTAVQTLLNLIFPPRCVGCRARGDWLCPSCRSKLARLPDPHCNSCARPVAMPGVCRHCLADPPRYDSMCCGFLLDGAIREAIHQLKYRGARHLAPLLATETFQVIAPPPAVDLIVPVPLHPSRQARRGYNQAQLLAVEFGRQLQVAVCPEGLRRIRDTASQTSLPAPQRHRNVHDAFEPAPRSVAGRTVLLVDDVATTGSTLSEAATSLKRGGALRVDALVVARAP